MDNIPLNSNQQPGQPNNIVNNLNMNDNDHSNNNGAHADQDDLLAAHFEE